jgi:hypothetical protein
MKRSKIFLGVTTCLLAVAGVAAAKRFGPSTTRYYITLGTTKCLAASGLPCVKNTATNANPCTVSFQTTHLGMTKTWSRSVYTDNTCLSQLKYTAN